MKHKAEISSLKKGDYLEIKYSDADMMIVRVTNIQQNDFFIGLSKIQMKVLSHLLGEGGHITWDFEYLQSLLIRTIQSPSEKNMIRLLYD